MGRPTWRPEEVRFRLALPQGEREVTLLNVVRIDIPWTETDAMTFDIETLRQPLMASSKKYLADVQSRFAADLRQAEGFAAVWVTVRQKVPRNGAPSAEGEDLEHWVLRRTPEGWRVILLTLPWLSH